MNSKEHAACIKQYQDTLLAPFTTYAAYLERVLRKAVKRYAPLGIVQARPKAVPSFAEKILRKGYEEPFVQMTDLCGARVITVTEAQMEAVSSFIKANVEVDYANSLDVGQRLGASEFGYRSVHYVVQCRPGACLDEPVPPEILPRPGVPFKAEIQVRTMLQHGWSEVLHDRLYKNSVKVPRSLAREGARLAALLEEGDGLISRVVRDIDSFVVDIGAYMDGEAVNKEIVRLDKILENEKDKAAREKLALRMSKLLRAGSQWFSIIALLHPFAKQTENAALLREYGNALCEFNEHKPRCDDYVQGQETLLRALELEPENADTHAVLARSYQRQTRAASKAHDHFRKAYHLDPENPYHFAAYVEYELLHAPSSALIPMIVPTLRRAIATCARHIEVGVELPRAYLTLGKLHLLLGDAYASLDAYAKGLRMVLDKRSGLCTDCLERELDSLARLENAKGGLHGDAWTGDTLVQGLQQVLLISLYLATGDAASITDLKKMRRYRYKPESRVLMVAGGCNKEVEKAMHAYGAMLAGAVGDFEGFIIGGGTRAGISGVVGSLKTVPKRAFETVGYLPGSQAADSRYDATVKSDTREFTPLDAIQAWVDVIASGIRPEQVSVLGFNGGAISAAEYRIGLAFGVSVGVMAGSGRAADALLKDPCWKDLGRPMGLISDPMTLRAFIHSGTGSIPPGKREELAREIHIAYCKFDTARANERILKDNGLPWKVLPQTYKDANYAQADYIGEILKTEGFRLVPVEGKADNSAIHFDSEQVERMAEKEHGRWNVERLRDGWRPGKRDDAKKTHDCLVSWETLPDKIKRYDRDSVNAWPKLLARVGIEIRK